MVELTLAKPKSELKEPGTVTARTYEGIQCLRFVAALMVVLVHSSFYVSERLDPDFPVWSRGTSGVDIFFVISGFVMFYTYPKLRSRPFASLEFFSRRLVRIVPTYWAATTLKILIMIVLPGAALHASLGDMGFLAKSYFFIPSYNMDGRIEPLLGVGWTLIFEMFFYAVFTIALLIKINPLAFCSAVLVPFAFLSSLRQADWPAVTVYFSPLVLEFLIGMAVAAIADRLIVKTWMAIVGLILGFSILILAPAGEGLAGHFVTNAAPAGLLVLSVVALERHVQGRVPATVLFFGAASYSLYLIHPIVAPAVPQVLDKLGLYLSWLSLAGSVLVALVAAAVMYLAFEKPLTAFLSNRLSSWLRALRSTGG